MADQHIMPSDDLRSHESSARCWCAPVRDNEDPAVVIHNSLDRREDYETGARKAA